MSSIVHIPSKSVPYQYRGYKATLTYVRDTKMWHWEFSNVVVTEFQGEAKTIDEARKKVRQYVDTIIGPTAD